MNTAFPLAGVGKGVRKAKPLICEVHNVEMVVTDDFIVCLGCVKDAAVERERFRVRETIKKEIEVYEKKLCGENTQYYIDMYCHKMNVLNDLLVALGYNNEEVDK